MGTVFRLEPNLLRLMQLEGEISLVLLKAEDPLLLLLSLLAAAQNMSPLAALKTLAREPRSFR